MQRKKVLIIGAGPTGLGAAYHLKNSGEHDYQILEREPWVGGLATSFVDGAGFTWDVGGHVQFSHYDYFDEAMTVAIPKSEWLHHERESWVWMKNRFVPYPFQNNIRYLPKDSMWKCFRGLIELAETPPTHSPRNFGEWIQASFGSGVAEEFMLPYNFKVWAYPPDTMSYQWIGERVATVNLQRIAENIIFEKMDASWGPNNTFQFPTRGGTGAIWNSIASYVGRDKIRNNCEVVSIDPKEKLVRCKDGSEFRYEQLLSSIPLDIFTSLVEGTSAALRKRAKELRHSTSNIIGIGVEGQPIEKLSSKCWMYFPEESCPFYRMTMFSNYSPHNVPNARKQYSLMCEVSESPVKPVNRATMIEDTIRGLHLEGLLPQDHRIISRWSYTASYGYPTPSLERDAILRDVIPELDALGTYSRGRFGGWKYEVSNQDHSFMQGVEWVDYIRSGVAERTYRVDTSQDPNLSLRRAKPKLERAA